MERNIVVTESFFHSLYRLDSMARKLTFTTIEQLANNPKSHSLRIHSVDRVKCDERFRSARVNDDIRVIFVDKGKTYSMLYVDRHDDAYNWCKGKYLKTTNFGAEYIFDEEQFSTHARTPQKPFMVGQFNKSILQQYEIKKKHLVKLGVPEIHAEALMDISDESDLLDYVTVFPEEIQEALLELASGTRFDEVYNSLLDDQFDETTDDALEHKDSRRRFYKVESLEELDMLMSHEEPEKWKLFLHPSQEKVVKANFNGPCLIEGGPGTGKTVAGIHRALYLSQHVYNQSNERILLCTFSKKLAKYIQLNVDSLACQRGIEEHNIDVAGVDSLIFNLLSECGVDSKIVNEQAFDQLFEELYREITPEASPEFFRYEYHEVIEKHDVKTIADYLVVDRSGTGVPLDASKRTKVWRFFDRLLAEKRLRGIMTFSDKAKLLHDSLVNGSIQPMYDSIIIDEAQDLEPVKLRALCRLVRTSRNNIMILSDVNQRIFRLNTWKNDVDINVIGRTHYLSVNYRTTKQISDYAKHQFVQSNMIRTHLRSYKSIVNGPEPQIEGFANEAAQFKFLADKVCSLLDLGIRSEQICIVCPTNADCNEARSVLTLHEIHSTVLSGDLIPSSSSGVCICPIQGVKGLEFEVVIIFNYNKIGKFLSAGSLPSAAKVNYLKLVECGKYVAMTRARDELVITYVEEEEQ